MKFSTKLNVMTVTLLVVCTAAMGWIFWYFLVREVKSTHFRSANQMAEWLLNDPRMHAHMGTEDNAWMTAYFEEMAQRRKDLRFLAIFKPDGAILTDTSNGEAVRQFDWKTLLAPSRGHGLRSLVKRDLVFRGRPEDIYLALLPIFYKGGIWGYAALGFSLREFFHSTLPKIFMFLVGAWLGLSSVCALIVFALIHSFTSPIQDLMQGVRRISSGDFDYPLPIKSRDELGVLATLFNRMRESLKETFNRLQKLSPLDEITRIYSQNFFHILLKQELARSARYRYPITLLLVQVSDFSALKKSEGGHLDAWLLQLTRGFQNCIRNTDTLARYKEDIWAMVLIQSDRKNARPVEERIWKAVQSLQDQGSGALKPAVRLGWAEAFGDRQESLENLVARAENDLKQGLPPR